jgi:hypothetical protein
VDCRNCNATVQTLEEKGRAREGEIGADLGFQPISASPRKGTKIASLGS